MDSFCSCSIIAEAYRKWFSGAEINCHKQNQLDLTHLPLPPMQHILKCVGITFFCLFELASHYGAVDALKFVRGSLEVGTILLLSSKS